MHCFDVHLPFPEDTYTLIASSLVELEGDVDPTNNYADAPELIMVIVPEP